MSKRSPYSSAAITLHWLIALLVIGQFIGIQYAHGLPEGDPSTGTVYMIHKSTGITILALTLIRLIIRLTESFPPLPVHMARWEVILARGTHILFYLLLLIVPLAGWAFAVTPERGLDWYGVLPIPALPLSGARDVLHDVHEIAAQGIFYLFFLHVAGALKHHFLDRDDVLTRMIPALRRTRG
ncbi:cytochrome b [Pacificimonas flava]|uniref:Cytochrome B561 n=1 Tax=Pacificimonas flava TaxID=1234595 RepID=M2TBZ2_9SPHN|nr:cytochrome b [Pacificimonas flava]EMD84149.1 Cytochrome B561 [Pacificimonas flava]MBB5279973.1 cytochrome b561 [Pacificimonas flava]